ncbi:MAG: HPF/RaiA family ribosome-associated protein [Phycisphaerales bacterium]|jgi:ribosomal subunit interface protein|nr:HPF/RaiA family ribosome-associated protein [Phycisphaerales bacterium]
MLIETRAMGFDLTDAIRMHVENRIESALGHYSRWVLKVTARLEDINADRGGVDKRCGLVIAIRGHGVLAAEAMDRDLYAAIDEAARRARKLVVRPIRRQMQQQRKSGHRHQNPIMPAFG